MGVRPIGRGMTAMLMAGQMHPPFLFWPCQKRNGPCTVQREKTLRRVGLRPRRPPAAGGGRLAVPRGSQGRKRAALGETSSPGRSGIHPAPLFAAAGCSSWERERQRGERLRVSQTSPGQRSPQGRRVSGPDFYKGAPTIPRRRQEVCACADRPAEAFFLFGPCTARFSFGKTKREMGGASAQPSAWLNPPPNGADSRPPPAGAEDQYFRASFTWSR